MTMRGGEAGGSEAPDRYVIRDEIASGGMATIHLGVRLGRMGFTRIVAIKRLHAFFAKDPDFVSMFMDEARLAARISHPNVVSVLDVVQIEGELCLVMDYVPGESLSQLVRAVGRTDGKTPPHIAAAIVLGALHGLHAAHEAKSERGAPLGIVHRDVSPQNIIVDVDGVPRVLDFGVAKAVDRLQTTRDGQIKGKIAYMAPEQLRGAGVDRRTDVYSAAVVLWELLAGRSLFVGKTPPETMTRILESEVQPPSAFTPGVPAALDQVVLRGLARNADQRFSTALDMAAAIEANMPATTQRQIGEWVRATAKDSLAVRAALVERVEAAMASPGGVTSGVVARSAAPAVVVDDATIVDAPLRETTVSVPPRRRAIAIGAIAVVLGVAATAWIIGRSGASSDGHAAPSTSDTSTAPLSIATAAAPKPSAVVTTVEPVVASASHAPSKRPPPAKMGKTVAPDTGTKPPPVNCSPPYTIAPDGVHIPKKECM